MSYTEIKTKRYKNKCEAVKKGIVCGYEWETATIPKYCSRCKSPTCHGKKRSGKTLTFNGQSLTVNEWAKKLNMKPNTIYVRLKRGWDIEDCLDPSVFAAGRKPKEVA